jgi:peroxiredoxin Q/BCP
MPLVEPGLEAPAFSRPDQDGRTRRLKDYAGRPLILYFYPKDDTPGCTKETCAFRDALPDFKKGKAAVLGVSVLDTASKANYMGVARLTYLIRPDRTVVRRWDRVNVDGHAADVLRAVDEL